MRVFISHKFRGRNKKKLRKSLEKICALLEAQGNETFVFFRDKENWGEKKYLPGEVISAAFKEIEKSDSLLYFVDHKEPSKGALLEFGYAKALNKKTVLLISEKYSFPILEAIADTVIKFEKLEEIEWLSI